MDYLDELKVRELTSRMGGHRLQQRVIELLWHPEAHHTISSNLPSIMDDLDEMSSNGLHSLIAVLDRHGCYDVNQRALGKLLRTNGKSEGSIERWALLMDRHFERLLQDEYGYGLDIQLLLVVVNSAQDYYNEQQVTDLTSEQEWALLTVTAAGMDKNQSAVVGQLSRRERHIRDNDLVNYIINNTDRTLAIIKAMADKRITSPAQLEAYFAGNRTVLLEGAL